MNWNKISLSNTSVFPKGSFSYTLESSRGGLDFMSLESDSDSEVHGCALFYCGDDFGQTGEIFFYRDSGEIRFEGRHDLARLLGGQHVDDEGLDEEHRESLKGLLNAYDEERGV